MAVSPQSAYDILTKMQALINAAQQYIKADTAPSEQQAIVLLTQACNVGLTFVPAGKIPLAFAMTVDTALAEQEADACQSVSQSFVQGVDSIGDHILSNLENQSYGFGDNQQQILFDTAISDATSGNLNGAISSADQALAIPTKDGSTTTLISDGSLVISYANTDPTQDWKSLTASVSSSWQPTLLMVENSNNTSQVTTFSSDGTSITESWSSPNGMGDLTEKDQENANGTSQITIYNPFNPDAPTTTTSYTGPNGPERSQRSIKRTQTAPR